MKNLLIETRVMLGEEREVLLEENRVIKSNNTDATKRALDAIQSVKLIPYSEDSYFYKLHIDGDGWSYEEKEDKWYHRVMVIWASQSRNNKIYNINFKTKLLNMTDKDQEFFTDQARAKFETLKSQLKKQSDIVKEITTTIIPTWE